MTTPIAIREEMSLSVNDVSLCEQLPTQRQRDLCSGRATVPQVSTEDFRRYYLSKPHTPSVKKPTEAVKTLIVIPREGPGTELAKLFSLISIKMKKDCGCQTMIDQMNIWGVEGCEENFEKIVSHLDEAQHQYRWTDKLRAATATVWSGLAFKIDPLNPFPSLVRIAIENAKASCITQQG